MTAINEIAAERRRQIEGEHWSIEHDDKHTNESLAMAAACYALPREAVFALYRKYARGSNASFSVESFDPWPWWQEYQGDGHDFAMEAARDKRNKHDRRKCLVIAGALIIAEIERIDRAAAETAES